MKNHQPYNKYKNSNTDWIGHIPVQWEVKKAKFLFKIVKRISGELGYKVLSITQKGIKVKDIESGGGQLSMDYSKYQLVDKGDFGMNHMDLLTGYVDLSEYDGVMSPDYRVFKLKDKNCDSRYYLYLFQKGYWDKLFFPLGQGSSELGRWRLPADEFNLFELPVPSKEEQTSIANFLDKKTAEIKKFIELKEKTIELLKERKTAIINQAVTKGLDPNVEMKDTGIEWLGEIPKHWEVKKLKYFANYVNRGTTPNYIDSSNHKVVNQGIFSRGYWREDKIKYTDIKSNEGLKGTLQKNDVLLASTGGGVLGKVGFFEEDEGSYIADSHVTIIRDDNHRFEPKYLFNILSTLYTWIEKSLGQGATNQTEIQGAWLKSSLFPLPSIKEQIEIVDFLKIKTQEINQSISQAEKEIALIKEYQQSLISEAVTGKIDVREVII